MTFEELVFLNPKVVLKRGAEYPFVEMSGVTPGSRYVSPGETRTFNGSGTRFEHGDTLFARITPCLENGKIAQFRSVSSPRAFGSTEFFVFRHRPGVSDPGYIYYLATTETVRGPAEKSMVGASGRQRASIDSIREVVVPEFSIAAQKKIASILSVYDDLIENNERRIKILEEMAQNLYREWFVNFRFPGHEKVKMVDSPLGKIPEGWAVKEALEVAEIAIGKTPPRKEPEWFSRSPANVKWVSISDMSAGPYLLDTKEYLTDAAVEKFNVRRIPDNTVLMSFKLTVGRVAITVGEMLTNEAIAHFKIRADMELFSPEFLFLYLRAFEFSTLGNTSSIGTAINSKVVKTMPLLVPDGETLGSFHKGVEPLFRSIKAHLSRTDVLRQTRDLLLPKLISGELDVSELYISGNVD